MFFLCSPGHIIFTVWYGTETTQSYVTVCQLVGRERVDRDAKEAAREEATIINKSLGALQQCMKALLDGRPAVFRTSKLTMMLQKYVGGGSDRAPKNCGGGGGQ